MEGENSEKLGNLLGHFKFLKVGIRLTLLLQYFWMGQLDCVYHIGLNDYSVPYALPFCLWWQLAYLCIQGCRNRGMRMGSALYTKNYVLTMLLYFHSFKSIMNIIFANSLWGGGTNDINGITFLVLKLNIPFCRYHVFACFICVCVKICSKTTCRKFREGSCCKPLIWASPFDNELRALCMQWIKAKKKNHCKMCIYLFIQIPKVYWEHSTKRVLTMEFYSGGKVDDRQYMVSNGININKVRISVRPS